MYIQVSNFQIAYLQGNCFFFLFEFLNLSDLYFVLFFVPSPRQRIIASCLSLCQQDYTNDCQADISSHLVERGFKEHFGADPDEFLLNIWIKWIPLVNRTFDVMCIFKPSIHPVLLTLNLNNINSQTFNLEDPLCFNSNG